MKKDILPFLWDYAKRYKFWLIFYILVWIVFALICDSGMLYMLKILVDRISFSINNNSSIFYNLVTPVLSYLGLFSLTSICAVLHQFIKINSIIKIEGEIRGDIVEYIQKHSYSYFLESEGGDLESKFNSIPQTTSFILDNITQYCISTIISVITLVIILGKINRIFAIIFLSWFILYFFVNIILGKQQIINYHNVSESITKYNGKFLDLIINILSIKTFVKEQYEQENISKYRNEIYAKNQIHFKYNIFSQAIKQSLMIILMSTMIINIVILAKEHKITSGDIFFVINSICGMIWTCNWMSGVIRDTIEEIGSLKNSLNKLIKPFNIYNKLNAPNVIFKTGNLEFKNMCFSYEDTGKVIFNNFNCKIENKEKLAIVAPSGTGKTTLLNLLLRFHEISSGEIIIDGYNIQNITQESLRENITYISQNAILFHRTIKENILYGNLNATEEELIDICKKTKCYDFINACKNGFDFIVGERGEKLSGGERQRILIARALLKSNSKIFIFDESLSALDSNTSGEINDLIQNCLEDKTVIVISHDKENLKYLDRFIELKKIIL